MECYIFAQSIRGSLTSTFLIPGGSVEQPEIWQILLNLRTLPPDGWSTSKVSYHRHWAIQKACQWHTSMFLLPHPTLPFSSQSVKDLICQNCCLRALVTFSIHLKARLKNSREKVCILHFFSWKSPEDLLQTKVCFLLWFTSTSWSWGLLSVCVSVTDFVCVCVYACVYRGPCSLWRKETVKPTWKFIRTVSGAQFIHLKTLLLCWVKCPEIFRAVLTTILRFHVVSDAIFGSCDSFAPCGWLRICICLIPALISCPFG